MASVLAAKRFIENVEEVAAEGKSKELRITLPADRDPLELKRISKPGQRIYVGFKDIKHVRNGLGVALISTSHGVISDGEAREKKIGGEYLCEVY